MIPLFVASLAVAGAQSAPAAAAPAAAEAPPPDPASDEIGPIPGVPPGPPPPADKVQNLSYQIGAKLRCPVCQGLSVADSTSVAAIQMQNRIRDLVAAGYAEDQVEAYFVERYGESILLDPPTGTNPVIWLCPVLGVGVGLAWVGFVVLKWRKEPDEVPLPSDVGLVPKDPYEQRLLAELEE